jgi:hypothetical protein
MLPISDVMRMQRKSREVVFGNIVAEVVQRRKKNKAFGVAKIEGEAKMDACAPERGLGLN